MRLTAYIRLLLLFLTVFLTAMPICGQGATPPAYFVFDYPPDTDTFVFKLTDPQKIQEARDILATGARKKVAGTIIKQPVYYNSSWSYHLDPKSIGFPEFAIELCDAGMRYLEENLDSAYPGWCPWNSRLLREIPPPEEPGTENLKPTISMTFPHADNVYEDTSLASVTLLANADDADGSITAVEFSSGGNVIGASTTYPYSFTWQNLPAGKYTVSATATDDKGARTFSKSVTFLINTGPPQLLTDFDSGRALALDSVTLKKEPISVVAEHFLAADQRTRLILIGLNLELKPGETVSAITAQAEDAQQKTYLLAVESVSSVPKFPWLIQVIVKLPDELQGAGEVWLSVSLRGNKSNKVSLRIK
jgi:Big-like domain-containing protein